MTSMLAAVGLLEWSLGLVLFVGFVLLSVMWVIRHEQRHQAREIHWEQFRRFMTVFYSYLNKTAARENDHRLTMDWLEAAKDEPQRAGRRDNF